MIGLAVVGLGWWGSHITCKLDGDPELEVVATADPATERGATYGSLDEVLADPAVDAVALCTPHSLHETQVLQCVNARKHVFCEKPLTLTASGARRVVEACRANDLVLGIGHERRFEPGMQEVRRLANEGELGTLLHAEATFNHDLFASLPGGSWRSSPAESPAAGMTAMGVHLTDALISTLGPVSQVRAISGQRVLALASGDALAVLMRFTSGATASVTVLSSSPFYGRFAVFGSRRWVEIRDDDHPEQSAGSTLVTRATGSQVESRILPATDAVLANLHAFAGAVAGNDDYPFTDDELVHNVAVLEAIVASAAQDETVDLDQVS